jgi:GNAT superfamily N-acetyltransferase
LIQINQVNDLDTIKSNLLRERAERSKTGRTLEFLAMSGESEAAFLSFEDWSDKSLGFIYEIFVLPEFRNEHLGSALLARAEEVAINLGCSRLELDVHAFDRTIDKASLYSWYSDKGYVRISNKSERMAKSIGKMPNKAIKKN